MSSRNDLYYFVDAKKSDEKAMLEILEEADFSGHISIIYTRRPSPLDSLNREGKAVKVILCKRKDTDDLIGFGVCAVRDFYIGGHIQPVAYLSGLRIRKDYRKKFVPITKAYDLLGQWIKDQGVKWVYTTVLEENTQVIKMFSKRRKSMPHYNVLDKYVVYSPSVKLRRTKHDLDIRPVRLEELEELEIFLRTQGQKRDFYPALSLDDLQGKSYLKLDYKKFYIAKKDQEILACGYVSDRHEDKQHILYSYSKSYKFLSVLSPLLIGLGYPKMPKEGSVLKYYNLAFLRGKDSDINHFVREVAYKNRHYDYFLVGLVESDPLSKVFSHMSKLTYKSLLYRVDYEKTDESQDLEKDLKDLYIECALL